MQKKKATEIVAELIGAAYKRFKQELAGSNEEFLDRVLRKHRAKVVRYGWKASQKWCKWDNDGPILMPDHTRIYYRKGNSEILLQEFPPQIRLMKFKGSLVNRDNSMGEIDPNDASSIHTFSLALPYVIFIFKFVNGLFVEVRCAFSDRPLKRLEERPLRPYLSNLDTNLSVCLGSSFDRQKLIKDNLAQQAAFVLDHFWHTSYSDEWSTHFWATRAHFQANDERLAGIQSWEEASQENSLFVVENVDWLKHQEESFGDMMVRLLEDDPQNAEMQQDLYSELVDEFFEELKIKFTENINGLEENLTETVAGELADQLLAKL
jgi:hypothetical protein